MISDVATPTRTTGILLIRLKYMTIASTANIVICVSSTKNEKERLDSGILERDENGTLLLYKDYHVPVYDPDFPVIIKVYEKNFIGKTRIGYFTLPITNEEKECTLTIKDYPGEAQLTLYQKFITNFVEPDSSLIELPGLYIDMDKTTYYPLDKVTGKVVFNTPTWTKAMVCNVRLSGYEKTKIMISSGKVVFTYKGKQHIVDTLEYVWRKGSTDPIDYALAPGTYMWPFEFDLPDKSLLLPTYEFHRSHFGGITTNNIVSAFVKYSVSVSLDESNKSKPTTMPITINLIPDFVPKAEDRLLKVPIGEGDITIKVDTADIFYIGEQTHLNLQIQNNTNKTYTLDSVSIKMGLSVKGQLDGNFILQANELDRMKEKKVAEVMCKTALAPNNCFSGEYDFVLTEGFTTIDTPLSPWIRLFWWIRLYVKEEGLFGSSYKWDFPICVVQGPRICGTCT